MEGKRLDAINKLLSEVSKVVNRLHNGAVDELDARVISENLMDAAQDLKFFGTPPWESKLSPRSAITIGASA